MPLNFDIFCATLPFLDDRTAVSCMTLSKACRGIVSRALEDKRTLVVCVRNLKNTSRLMRSLSCEPFRSQIVIVVAADNPMCCYKTSLELGSLCQVLQDTGFNVIDIIESYHVDHLIQVFKLEKKTGVNYDSFLPSLAERITWGYHNGRMFTGYTESVNNNWRRRLAHRQVKERFFRISFPLLDPVVPSTQG
jgi:hypothetical protein